MKKSTDNAIQDQPTGRRKTLKKLLVGGGVAAVGSTLPTKWTKPVVDSIILPAHAQTTVVPEPTAAPQDPITTPAARVTITL